MSKNKQVKIKPLGDKVLLEELNQKDETTTASGIILPAGSNPESDIKKGTVIAVGEGKKIEGKIVELQVKVGEVVLYSWGDRINIDGKKYIIVSSDNISAIIE